MYRPRRSADLTQPRRVLSGCLLVALATGGCAASTSAATGKASIAAAATTAPAIGAPTIDWSRPLANGQDVAATQFAAPSAGPAMGLSFTPVVPALAQRLSGAQVTDSSKEPPQGRGVALIFDFSGSDPRFASDGRVDVIESPARMTEADLEDMPNHPVETLTYRLVHEGSATTALLVSYNGVGRVLFIHDGVQFNIVGPTLPPDVALQIGDALVHQIGG